MCTHKTSLYSSDDHQWVQTAKRGDQICRYDVDDLDVRWLQLVGARRAKAGMEPVTEEQMEMIMERLESDCYESIQEAVLEPSTQRIGREFDENSACDICLSVGEFATIFIPAAHHLRPQSLFTARLGRRRPDSLLRRLRLMRPPVVLRHRRHSQGAVALSQLRPLPRQDPPVYTLSDDGRRAEMHAKRRAVGPCLLRPLDS